MIASDENGPSADSVPTKLDELNAVTAEVEAGGTVRAEIGDCRPDW